MKKQTNLGAVSAVGLVLVVALGGAACGGHKADAGKGGSPSPGGKNGVALTQEQLERAEAPAGTVPGWLTHANVGEHGADLTPADLEAEPRTQVPNPSCQALYNQVENSSRALQPSHAVAEETFYTPDGAARSRALRVMMRVYTAADAQQVMADLRASLKSCTGRFAAPIATAPDPSVTFHDFERLPDPADGDEGVAFRIVQTIPPIPGEKADARAYDTARDHIVVVRSGTTVATFSEEVDYDQRPQVPASLVTAQVQKLSAAAP